MKVMISAFLCAVALAAVASMLLETTFQETADVRFTSAGAELRHAEAGSNLVGTNWNGLNFPSANH
jgi:hypothetical protein